MPEVRRGRIKLSYVEVDNGYDTTGSNLSLKDDHISSVKQIDKSISAQKRHIYHCNCIKEFIKCVKESRKRCCDVGATKLTRYQKANEEFYYEYTHDLICSGFNVKIFKSFLDVKKKKTKNMDTKINFIFRTCASIKMLFHVEPDELKKPSELISARKWNLFQKHVKKRVSQNKKENCTRTKLFLCPSHYKK